MRRSTVLSLPLQLGFPDLTLVIFSLANLIAASKASDGNTLVESLTSVASTIKVS